MAEPNRASARLKPFAGTRYDEELAPLAEVIAPPYDVIDDAERSRLGARSSYNAVHLELPEADPASHEDRFEHASSLLSRFEREGALRRDDVAALYAYKMEFDDEGETRSTLGVIGALDIDPVSVLPHEATTAAPREHLLGLLRATRTNLSPIWALSPAVGLTELLEEAIGDLPAPLSATDDAGVLHEVWPLVDPDQLAAISSLVAKGPVLIADGHHRYESARAFGEEHKMTDDAPEASIMAFVVELVSSELHVAAIHRLLPRLDEPSRFETGLHHFFEVHPGPSELAGLIESMDKLQAIGLLTKDTSRLLVPRRHLEAELRRPLDSARVDHVLAELGIEPVYQHGTEACRDAVRDGSAEAAFLLRPPSVEEIAATAEQDRRMPPKTTFFYPKPRSGMVYRTM